MLSKISTLAVTGLLGAATLLGGASLGSSEAEAGYKHRHYGHKHYGYTHRHYGHKHYGYKRHYGYRYYKPSHYGCKVWSHGYHKKCLVWWSSASRPDRPPAPAASGVPGRSFTGITLSDDDYAWRKERSIAGCFAEAMKAFARRQDAARKARNGRPARAQSHHIEGEKRARLPSRRGR